jgi:hypothetical protein
VALSVPLRLFLLRWLSVVLLGVPGFLGAASAIGDSAGRSPFFTESPRPMPIFEILFWGRRIPGLAWAAVAASGLAVWLAGLFLTAGAARVLQPNAAERGSVWRAAIDAGSRAFLPYLRIAACAALAIAAMNVLLRFADRRLTDHAVTASWTGQAMLELYAGRGVLLFAWATLVGVLAFWSHVLVAADRRRLVRRLIRLVPGVILRRPGRALFAQMAAGTLSLAIGGVTLALWLQTRHARPLLWLALWVITLAAQSALWLWRVHACSVCWASSELGGLRETPDEPWHVFRRLWSWGRRWRRSPG